MQLGKSGIVENYAEAFKRIKWDIDSVIFGYNGSSIGLKSDISKGAYAYYVLDSAIKGDGRVKISDLSDTKHTLPKIDHKFVQGNRANVAALELWSICSADPQVISNKLNVKSVDIAEFAKHAKEFAQNYINTHSIAEQYKLSMATVLTKA